MSALLVGMRDVLLSDDFDLVVKVHARRPKTRSANVVRYFHRYQTENLLGTAGYFANVLALFQREPGLGIVMPPMIHIDTPRPARGGRTTCPRATEVAKRLGIQVPFDGVSPLAPLGGMWICRPQALAPLSRPTGRSRNFGKPATHRKADMARVLERLVTYGAGEAGYHTRTVLSLSMRGSATSRWSTSWISSHRRPLDTRSQIQFLQRSGWMGKGRAVAMIRMHMNLNHPEVMERMRPVLAPLMRVARVSVGGLRQVLRSGAGLLKGGRR